MPECRKCGDEVESLVVVRVGGKRVRMCEECADRLREENEIAEESENVVRGMLGFRGQR